MLEGDCQTPATRSNGNLTTLVACSAIRSAISSRCPPQFDSNVDSNEVPASPRGNTFAIARKCEIAPNGAATNAITTLVTAPLRNRQVVGSGPTRGDSDTSWTIDTNAVDPGSLDLSVKNPNKTEDIDTRTPSEILDKIQRLDDEARELLNKIRELL